MEYIEPIGILLEKFATLLWPLIVLVTVIIFRVELSNVVRKIKHIKVKDVEIDLEKAKDAVYQREELLAWIKVSGAGKKVKEIKGLLEAISTMKPYLKDLQEDWKEGILRSAFNLAMKDATLDENERKALIGIAMDYGYTPQAAKTMVDGWEVDFNSNAEEAQQADSVESR